MIEEPAGCINEASSVETSIGEIWKIKGLRWTLAAGRSYPGSKFQLLASEVANMALRPAARTDRFRMRTLPADRLIAPSFHTRPLREF